MSASELAASSCCSKTPVPTQTDAYTPKGTWREIANLDCYVVGDVSSKKVIIDVMDVFGVHDATLQGADLLAARGYLVVFPDFFAKRGGPLLVTDFPCDTKEKEDKFTRFFVENGDMDVGLASLRAVAEELKAENSGYEFAMCGSCWGGRMAHLAADSQVDIFRAAAAMHPYALVCCSFPLSRPIMSTNERMND